MGFVVHYTMYRKEWLISDSQYLDSQELNELELE